MHMWVYIYIIFFFLLGRKPQDVHNCSLCFNSCWPTLAPKLTVGSWLGLSLFYGRATEQQHIHTHTHTHVVAMERNLNYIARFNQSAMPTDTQYDGKSAAFGVCVWGRLTYALASSSPSDAHARNSITAKTDFGQRKGQKSKTKKWKKKKKRRQPSNRARVNRKTTIFLINACRPPLSPLASPTPYSLLPSRFMSSVLCSWHTWLCSMFMCLSVAHKKLTKVDKTKKFLLPLG